MLKNILLELYLKSKMAVLSPERFWKKQKKERSIGSVVPFSHIITFLFLICLSAVIGGWISNLKYGTDYWFLLFKAIRDGGQFLITLYLTTWIVREFFATEVDDRAGILQLVFYSLIPAYLTTIVTNIFSGAYVLELFTAYSYFILYKGIPKYIFRAEENGNIQLFVWIIGIAIAVSFCSYYILWNILEYVYTVL